MSNVILSAILVMLGILALELYLILIQLARFPGSLKLPETKAESPTINVNVGTGQAYEPRPEPAAPPPAEPVPAPEILAEPAQPEPPVEPEPSPPPLKPRHVAGASATASGLVALRCPACQAENSSYRSECFSCGAPLS